MATRSILAVKDTDKDTWYGVYVHWDGYPSGWPATIRGIVDDGFGGDIDAAINGLIHSRKSGWSSLLGDWKLAPVNIHAQPGISHVAKYYPAADGEADFRGTMTTVPGANMGAEYVYVIDPQARTVTALKVHWSYGTIANDLSVIGVVSLDLSADEFEETMSNLMT